MKKYIISLGIAFITLNCNNAQIKTAELKQEPVKESTPEDYQQINYYEIEKNGMNFGVWYQYFNGSTMSRSAIHVINLTKDSIEIKLAAEQYAQLINSKK